MAKTVSDCIDELEKCYKKLASLTPYQNDPGVSREIRELRGKINSIESIEVVL